MIERKILAVLLGVDGVILVVSALFFDKAILLNTQIGFVTASLVLFASMSSYKKMVETRIEHDVITADIDKDVIDKLEDPYDLYSEEVKEEVVEDVAAAIKAERARHKANKRSLFEVLRDTKAALSLKRLGAYLLLVLGFFYLHRHQMLQIPTYLFSLSLPLFLMAFMLMLQQRNLPQE